jgi:hypothetical protein
MKLSHLATMRRRRWLIFGNCEDYVTALKVAVLRETCQSTGELPSSLDTYFTSNPIKSHTQTRARIFKTVVEHTVAHDPQDQLEDISIPMTPDRVTALSFDSGHRTHLNSGNSNLIHCPFNDTDFAFYPFLVIEAKKEDEVPGFSAIETQTAFPIRRFLKVQDELRKESRVDHDPLVWFLAFRGDEWRLYAGTLNGETVVRIFLETELINS